MSPTNPSHVSQASGVARALRMLYFVRAAFALVWAGLLAAHLPALTPLLLLLYPTWDVAATFADLRATRRLSRHPSLGVTGPRYLNIVIGLATTVAVAVALHQGTPAVLLVFGVWAVLTGLIQLALGWRRHRTVGGQWPMILSGGQSALAGTTFVVLAHMPTQGVQNLIGYAAFGGFYFLLAALRMRVEVLPEAAS